MPVVWPAFVLLIGLLLVLDLALFRRHGRVSVTEALAWTGFWIVLALAFNVLVFELYGHHWLGFGTVFEATVGGRQAALAFFAGYLLEKSLSIDNVLVIALIFAHFRVPLESQHRVLFWGVLGALLARGVLIAGGVSLLDRFAWMSYLLGVIVLITAVKLLVVRHDTLEPDKNPLVRVLRRRMPVTDRFAGDRFTVRRGGRRMLTPLAICLAVVGTSDVVFAVDSIPAIFSITRDPFLVFTSNAFAVLGLRALYFALAGWVGRLRYLKSSLVFLLVFVGVKMLLAPHHEVPLGVSVAVISSMLGVGIAATVLAADRDPAPLVSPLAQDLERLLELSLRQGRRVIILLVGSTVLLLGVAMIVLPGPAFIVIPAGLGILAVEFVWARRWLDRLKRAVRRLEQSARRRGWPAPRLGGGDTADDADEPA